MANDDPAVNAGKRPSSDFQQAAIRTIFSSAIAILFLLILMVAALQQQAASHLAAGMSYTSAHAQVSAMERWRKTLAADEKDLAARRSKAREIEQRQLDNRESLASSNGKVQLFAATITLSHLCPVLETPQPADTSLWGIVYQCWNEGAVPDSVRSGIKALAGSPDDPTVITSRIARGDADLKDVQDEIAAKEAVIKAEQDQLANAARIAENMEDVRVFDQSVLGWFGLTWIPPATMQIVLSFVSGLFGSLLVTLVLTVYPNNDLHFTGSDSYWSRILLGGLIAVGVYIVIGGGLAVLSANNADPDGSTNFLSFCAIGMLAGMFSDKFAGWLSDNAQKLTARRDPDKS